MATSTDYTALLEALQNSATPMPGGTWTNKNPGGVPGTAEEYWKTLADVPMFSNLAASATSMLAPYLGQSIDQLIKPQALAELDTAQAVSPAYAQLMQELYAQYGPQLNALGSQIAEQNAAAELATNRRLLDAGGMDMLKTLDPEYFNTRATTSSRLGDLLSSIDLSGKLSGGEIAAIERSLAQSNMRGGTTAPSNLSTVANAMQFGNAAYARKQAAQNALSQAINSATAFLPASRTGMEGFGIATGKTAGANTGEAKFTGIAQPDTSTSANLVNNLLSETFGLSGQSLAGVQAKKSKGGFLNKFTGTLGALGSLGGIFGKK